MDAPTRLRAERVRRFNRFYTQYLGVLQEGLFESPFSLTETRLLYELAHRYSPTASALAADLNLDAGYLSRILLSFERRKLLRRKPSPLDARQQLLTLTAQGRRTLAPLEERSNAEIAAMLQRLS